MNPDVITFLTFLSTSGFLIAFIKLIYTLGKQQESFSHLKDSVNNLSPVVGRLNSCVQEIQSVMKNKYKTLTLLKEPLDLYGVANSPIVLRDEYRHFLQESNLASQIEEKKQEIIELVKKKKPATGLDAQEVILDLVIADELEKILDTREFKKLLYQSGKTTKDYYLILAIYLFETIIPEVIKE